MVERVLQLSNPQTEDILMSEDVFRKKIRKLAKDP
jgi:hypothetical protein